MSEADAMLVFCAVVLIGALGWMLRDSAEPAPYSAPDRVRIELDHAGAMYRCECEVDDAHR